MESNDKHNQLYDENGNEYVPPPSGKNRGFSFGMESDDKHRDKHPGHDAFVNSIKPRGPGDNAHMAKYNTGPHNPGYYPEGGTHHHHGHHHGHGHHHHHGGQSPEVAVEQQNAMMIAGGGVAAVVAGVLFLAE